MDRKVSWLAACCECVCVCFLVGKCGLDILTFPMSNLVIDTTYGVLKISCYKNQARYSELLMSCSQSRFFQLLLFASSGYLSKRGDLEPANLLGNVSFRFKSKKSSSENPHHQELWLFNLPKGSSLTPSASERLKNSFLRGVPPPKRSLDLEI